MVIKDTKYAETTSKKYYVLNGKENYSSMKFLILNINKLKSLMKGYPVSL